MIKLKGLNKACIHSSWDSNVFWEVKHEEQQCASQPSLKSVEENKQD